MSTWHMATGVCSRSSNNTKNNAVRAIGVGFRYRGIIFLGEGLANHKICSAFEQTQTTHTQADIRHVQDAMRVPAARVYGPFSGGLSSPTVRCQMSVKSF